MTTSFATLIRCLAITAVVLSTTVAQAAFTSFVIREGANGPPVILPNNDYVPGATEFVISEGNQKAAWGSNDINGATIGNITNLSITRYDDTTRFAGPGAAGAMVAPYFNIWVTDGTNYAVVANEPSNAAFQPLFENIDASTKQYSLSYDDLADKVVKVYETPGWNTNSSWIHALAGPDPLTFADIAGLTIGAPDPSYINNPANSVGGGAPVSLANDDAYGFNWVFGDTLSNYVSGAEGYVVGSPEAQAVPEPSTIAILGLAGVAGLAIVRRRRQG